MGDFYNENCDFREFVDKNARAYGKSVEFMKLTPIAKEYEKYIKDKEKLRHDQNNERNSEKCTS